MFSCQICFLKSSLGSCDLPQKCWARSVQLFWRLLDSNKHTNKQRIYYAFKALRSLFSLDNLNIWTVALKFGHFIWFSSFWRAFLFELAHFQKKTIYRIFFLKFWCFINLSWGHVRLQTKIKPDWFSRFGYKRKDKQTNTEINKVYRYKHPDKQSI